MTGSTMKGSTMNELDEFAVGEIRAYEIGNGMSPKVMVVPETELNEMKKSRYYNEDRDEFYGVKIACWHDPSIDSIVVL